MRKTFLVCLVLFFMVAAKLALGGRMLVSAESAAYGLDWFSVDGGGGKSTNGGYVLQGSIGQPDAGPVLSGPGYQLAGGFWSGPLSELIQRFIYLPLIKK